MTTRFSFSLLILLFFMVSGCAVAAHCAHLRREGLGQHRQAHGWVFDLWLLEQPAALAVSMYSTSISFIYFLYTPHLCISPLSPHLLVSIRWRCNQRAVSQPVVLQSGPFAQHQQNGPLGTRRGTVTFIFGSCIISPILCIDKYFCTADSIVT